MSKRKMGFGLVLLAMVGGWFAVNPAREQLPEEYVENAAPDALEAAGPQAESVTTAATPSRPRGEPALPASTPSGRHTPAMAPQALSQEDLEIRKSERLTLNARWTSQESDSEWSAATEMRMIDLLLEAELEPEQVREVDCRSTICRFVLTGADGVEALSLIDAARAVHDETWVDHHHKESGAWEIEVYFSKRGYQLSGEGRAIASLD